MTKLSDLLKDRETKPAPHQLSDATNLIDQQIGFTKRYGRGYWLALLKGKNLNRIHEWLKLAQTKENPGRYLSAILRNN